SCAAAKAGRRSGLVAERARGELEPVAGDGNDLAIALHCLDLGGLRFENDGSEQIVAVGRIFEGEVERRLELGSVGWQAYKAFRASIAVAPIVLEDTTPDGSVGRVLVCFPDSGVDRDASGVAFLAVGFYHCQPDHFG